MLRMTGQELHELLRSPNGFILSILSASMMFLGLWLNFENMASKCFHC
jgi:hypothetical protein